MDEIFALSLNHRVTPLRTREQVAFNREDGERLLVALGETGKTTETLLISTCNRTEVYALAEPDTELEEWLFGALKDYRGFLVVRSPRNFMVARGEGAVRHLFRVAGGLESQILGESQVLGQLKRSLEWAQSAGSDGRVLHRLAERAFRVGKRVRTETVLGQGALSASYAALELARKVFGHLRGKRVLVIGTGEIGELALENLDGVGVGDLVIINRTRKSAEVLASRFHGRVRDLNELSDALVEADLVISSTASTEPLVRFDELRQVRQRRGGDHPLLIIDLAMPRDFEERCGTLDEVFVKNLDDLAEIVRGSTAERRKEIPHAEAIVAEELTTFCTWLRALEVEPTIVQLRELFHAIREEELEAVRRSLDDETFEQLERFARRLVNRLLHVPSENLRRQEELHAKELIPMVHRLLTGQVPHPKTRTEWPEDEE
jgi:glutamyl-tRNA reductase